MLRQADPNIGPAVVHCSAGVGRSGTYIAVDSALARLEVRLDNGCAEAGYSPLQFSLFH